MTCTSCGVPAVTGAKFCRSCGTAVFVPPPVTVVEPPPACPLCATLSGRGQRFCRGCGAGLTSEAVADRPSRAAVNPPRVTDDVETAERELPDSPPVSEPSEQQASAAQPAAVSASESNPAPSFTREVAWDLGSDALLDRAPTAPPSQSAPHPDRAVTVEPPAITGHGRGTDPSRACAICGAPAAWASDLCNECESSGAVPPRETQPAVAAVPTEYERRDPSPPPSEMPQPTRRRGRRRTALLVAVALVLLAGAGLAASLLLSGDDDEPRPRPRPAADAKLGAAAAHDDPRLAGAQSGTPAVSDGAGGGEAAGDTNPNTPTGVVRAHWEAIGAGDYDAAYAFFSSQYRKRMSSARWIAQESDFQPDVNLTSVRLLERKGGDGAYVFVEAFTRDRGPKGEDGVCNRFAGKVRVVKQDGEWRYWALAPGARLKGTGSIPSSDPRCAPLF